MPTFLFPEPAVREAKPAFADIPPVISEKIAIALGASVIGGDVVYGGFSAAANFVLTLADGRKVFAKGSHPGDDSHAVQTLRQEVLAYQNIPVLRDISPRFLGVVEDGDEDGWALGVWEYVERVIESPSLSTLLKVLDIVSCQDNFTIHPGEGRGLDLLPPEAGYNDNRPFVLKDSSYAPQTRRMPDPGLRRGGQGLDNYKEQGATSPFLTNCRQRSYVSGFFKDEKKWRWIAENAPAKDRFLSLFVDQEKGKAWLSRNLPPLLTLQEKIKTLEAEEGLLHGDLRLDNVFQDKNGKAYIVDWPNACRGPLVFDRLFLGASVEMHGLGRVEDVLKVPSLPLAVSIAGYFADQAGRVVPQKLPRLRWMQKSMLAALLAYLTRAGVTESLPEISG
jgi:hypothetical protein